MLKIFHYITIGLIFTISISKAQQVDYQKFGNNYKFTQERKTLNLNQLVELYKDVPEANALIKSAKSNAGLGMVLGYAGGFLIGYLIGTALGGGQPQWGLAAVGAGILLIGIPTSMNASKKAVQATDIYNNKIPATPTSSIFKIGITDTGFGFAMKF